MNKKILYLDMDQVLVDFHSHPKYIVPLDSYNSPLIFKKGYFRELKPTPFAIETTEELIRRRDLDVYILTHGLAGSSYCYQEKIEWVKEYLPELISKVIITCDKRLAKGDILVDDDIKWNDFEGSFIEFSPYNLLDHDVDARKEPQNYKAMWQEVVRQIDQEVGK